MTAQRGTSAALHLMFLDVDLLDLPVTWQNHIPRPVLGLEGLLRSAQHCSGGAGNRKKYLPVQLSSLTTAEPF